MNRNRRWRWGVLALCAAITACRGQNAKPPPPAPPAVQVTSVLVRDVPIVIEGVGQTKGSTDVEIRARVPGILEQVQYREGRPVEKGQVLFTIDPRPFQAALAQARGRAAEAHSALAKAKQDVARFRPLAERNAISRQDFDAATAALSAAEARVESADAAVRGAELDLGYTKIESPLAGLAGKSEVSVGNLVGQGQATVLTRISAIDPILVRFSISERDYLTFARASQGRAAAGGAPQPLPLTMVLADGSVHPHAGVTVFADRSVDPTTGTLLIEASFPNPDQLVRPGQFARVRAVVDERKGAILVPQRAVLQLQGTFSVMLVGADGKAMVRLIQPGRRIGSWWVIEGGLASGDSVVVEGVQKVRDGVTVAATPSPPEPLPELDLAPAGSPAPAAQE